MVNRIKAAAAATITAALLMGGVAVASPAFAAEKPLGKQTFEVMVLSSDYGHYDKLALKPTSKKVASRAGLKAYTTYSVTLKHGKKLLFSHKLGATKALVVSLESQLAYKSDAKYVAHLRDIVKESNAKATHELVTIKNALKREDRISTLNADVATTKLNIAAYLSEDGDPAAFPADGAWNTLGKGETITYSIDPSGYSFKVVATDSVTKVRVTFDSVTGKQTSTNIK